MAGRPERFIIEIFAKPDGGHDVVCDYVPVTPEASPSDQQPALELALNAMDYQAIKLRIEKGQRVPDVLVALDKAKTFMDFYP